MIKLFKKKTKDTTDINSWVFEKDIKQIFMEEHDKRSKRIVSIINVCLTIIVLTFFGVCLYQKKSILIAIKIVLCPTIIGTLGTKLLLKIILWVWQWKIVKKYWPLVVFPTTALVIVIILVKNIHPENNLSLQRSDILGFCGSFLTFFGSFCLGYFIYIQDCERRIEEKRSKVRLLLAQIEYAKTELLRLNQLFRYKKHNQISENQVIFEPIPFDSNWLIYYLEYESLEGGNTDLKSALSSFFDNIARVNVAIRKGEMESAVKINEQHIDRLMYSMRKYNELEAITCLMAACDDYDFYVTESWLELKDNIDLINELCRKYYFIIENYVYSWLLKHHVRTTTETDHLRREIVDWLLSDAPEIKEKIKDPSDKRIINRVVFDCSCKFNSQSKKVNYIWDEYSRK